MEGWLHDIEIGGVLTMEVAGTRGTGQPVRQWKNKNGKWVWVMGLGKGMASERKTWKRQIDGSVKPLLEGQIARI